MSEREAVVQVIRYRPREGASLRLFCLPYGGGGVSAFRDWADSLPSSVDVCSVLYPGRDSLIATPPIVEFGALVRRLGESIRPYLDRPCALFGHSLGALVGFEIARAMRADGGMQPRALVVSGHSAPHLRSRRRPIHHLPTPRFLEELRHLEGTPPGVLDNPELMDLYLPALRADFRLHETYRYARGDPLDIPIFAFAGERDKEVSPIQISAWRRQGRAGFEFRLFPGGHFFLHSARSSVLEALSGILARLVGPAETSRP